MNSTENNFQYPRRRIIRFILKKISVGALNILTDLHILGRENIPKEGPLLVVGNHFSFIDPVALIRVSPWPIEFLGGAEFPHAPTIVQSIPKLWGYYPVFRGTGSTYALKAAESILSHGGVLGVFPEAGNWAKVLRPARPGTAFIATRTSAKILPLGISGLHRIFPLRTGKRPKVTIRIGETFGPFKVTGKGRQRRTQLNEISHEIMRHIAELLPERDRGYYSSDPQIRAAAKGTENYPWEKLREGEVPYKSQ